MLKCKLSEAFVGHRRERKQKNNESYVYGSFNRLNKERPLEIYLILFLCCLNYDILCVRGTSINLKILFVENLNKSFLSRIGSVLKMEESLVEI